jgi:hypothetical protein
VAILRRLLDWLPGVAPVDFKSLSGSARSKAEALLQADPAARPPEEIVALLDGGRGKFRSAFERVLEEVRRRCEGAAIWQHFYLDLLDEEGSNNDGEEGVGADPVDSDEELRRLLAGVALFPEVRARFGWELGYHTLRYALARTDTAMHVAAARAAAADFLIAYQEATDVEGRINALGDLAGALFIAGDDATAILLCDYAAAEISPVEAVRQELHRLRREGAVFVRAGYGG